VLIGEDHGVKEIAQFIFSYATLRARKDFTSWRSKRALLPLLF